MINSLKSWLGQVTTGHGFMILAPTLLSVFSGTTSWTSAVPFLVAGAIGLVWPENTALQSSAQTVATDVAGMIASYTNQSGAGSKTPV